LKKLNKIVKEETMESIVEILMERDRITKEEAEELVESAREQLDVYLAEGDIVGAEEICQEYFGLEPDYIFDLL